jgi:hypothetical protein
MMTMGNRPSNTRLVAPAAWGLVFLATAWRAWSMQGTWFYFDDFPFMVQAAQHSLTVDHLMTPYVGHLMPAGRLFAWLATRYDTLDYLPFAIGLLAFFALAAAGMVRLMLGLFGRRWGILPPLVVFVLSPLLVESTLWWSAGINQLPALAGITWALDAHVRYLRSGRTGLLLASLAWVTFGLAFAEFTLVAYLFFIAITLAYFAHGALIERIRDVWAQHRRAVLAHGAVLIGYVVLYLQSEPEPFPPGRSHPLLTYLYNMGAKTFATTAVGGPLSWNKVWQAQIEVAPSDLLLILSWTALGVLVVAARRSRIRSMRSVVPLLLLLVLKVLLLSTERAVFGPEFALDVRFAYDLTLAFALYLGLAFLPVLGSSEGVERVRRDPLVDDSRIVIAAMLAFVVLATLSTARFPVRHLGQESPRSYIDNVRSSLKRISGPVQIAPGAVPAYITSATEGRYEALLPLVSDRFVFPKTAIDAVYVTDARGRLEPAQLTIARREDRTHARSAGCPFPLANDRVTIPLDGPVFGLGWLLRIDYRASTRLRASVTLGELRTTLHLPAGSHQVLMPATAAYDDVQILADGPSGSLCVDHVAVGMLDLEQ